MAIQILPKVGLAERLGTALGTGLGAGIQGLAQNKLAEIERQKGISQTQKALEALGAPPELAYLPEKLQPQALKDILRGREEGVFNQALEQIQSGEPSDIASLPVGPNLKSKLNKADLQERKFKYQQEANKSSEAAKAQRYIEADTKALRDTIYNSHQARGKTKAIIGRFKALNRTGKLDRDKLVTQISNVLGINATPFLSADAIEFEKLISELIKGGVLKDSFGSRVTNLDLTTFLKSLPSLLQTKEGRERVINNLEILDEMGDVRYKAFREIIKNNENKTPADLQFLLDDATEKEMEELEKLFVSGKPLSSRAKKKVEKETNKDAAREIATHPSEPTQNPLAPTSSAMQNLELQTPTQQAPQSRPLTPLEQIPLFGTHLAPQEKGNIGGLANLLQEGARIGGGAGLRTLESLLGNYPSLASLALQIPHSILEATTGKGIPGHEQIQNLIPSPETLHKGTKVLTGKTFEPRTPGEATLQRITGDIGTFLGAATNPATLIKSIPAIGKQGANIVKALAKATLLSGAANSIQAIGNRLYEGAGDLGKLIFAFGTGLLGTRKGVTENMKEAYKNVDKLGAGKAVSGDIIQKGAEELLRRTETGAGTEAKGYIKPVLTKILNDLELTNGKISVNNLLEIDKDINARLIKENIPAGADKWLNRLKVYNGRNLNEFSKEAPEFGSELKKAKEIFRATHNSSEVTKNINKYIAPGTIANHTIKAAFSRGLDAKHIMRGLSGIAIAHTAGKASDLVDLLKQSPEVRKYVAKAIGAAVLKHGGLAHKLIQKAEKKARELGYD